MKKQKVNVSIITPVYKGNKYLIHLLKNIENAVKNVKQFYVEWVIVNDYPNEDIISLSTMLDNLSIKIINNDMNQGIQKSRINGFKKSRGEYILFLDQDDEILPLSLKMHLNNIKNNDVSVSNGYVENEKKNLIPIYNTQAQLKCTKNIKYFFFIGDIIVSPGMVLIKKDAIPNSWINNTLKTNGADDWLLWVLMLADRKKVTVTQGKTYIHKKNDNNTSNDKKKMWQSTKEALDIFKKKVVGYEKLCHVFNRRIRMVYNFQVNGKNRIIEYIKNPDITAYLIYYKFLLKKMR